MSLEVHRSCIASCVIKALNLKIADGGRCRAFKVKSARCVFTKQSSFSDFCCINLEYLHNSNCVPCQISKADAPVAFVATRRQHQLNASFIYAQIFLFSLQFFDYSVCSSSFVLTSLSVAMNHFRFRVMLKEVKDT